MKKSLLIIILSIFFSSNSFGQDIIEVKVGTDYYCNIRGNTIFFDINPTFLSVKGINFKISNDKGSMYSYYVSVPGFASPNSGVDYSKASSVAIMEIHDDTDLGIYKENYIKSYNLLFLTTPGVALGAANREPNELYFPSINLISTLNGENLSKTFQIYKQGNDYYIQIANTFDTQNTALNFNFNSEYILSVSGNNLIKNTTTSGLTNTEFLPSNITQLNSLTVTYTNFEQKVFKVYVNVFTPVKSSYKMINQIGIGINVIDYRKAKILDNLIYIDVTTALGKTGLSLSIIRSSNSNVYYIIDNNFTMTGDNISNFSYAGNSFIIKAIAEDNSFQTYTVQINIIIDKGLSKVPFLTSLYVNKQKTIDNDYNDTPFDNSMIINDTIYLTAKPFKMTTMYTLDKSSTRPIINDDFKNIVINRLNGSFSNNMSLDGINLNYGFSNTRFELATDAFDASFIRKLTITSEDGSKTKDYFIKTIIPIKNYDFNIQPIQVEVNTKYNKTKFFGTITGNSIVVNIPANMSKSNLELYVFAPPGTLMYFEGNITNSLNPQFLFDFRIFKANFETPRLLTLWDKNGVKKEFTITVNNILPIENYENNFNNKFGLTHLELIQSDFKSYGSNVFPIIFSTANTGKVILPFDSKPYFEGDFRTFYGNVLSISGIIHGTYSELSKNINTFGTYQIKEITESGEIRDYVITIEKATSPSSNKKLDFIIENSLVIQSITGNNFRLIFKNNTDLSDLNLKINLNKYYQNNTSQQININFHEKLWVNDVLIFTKKDIYSTYSNLDLMLNLTSPNIIKIQAQDLSTATYTVTGENYAQPKLPFNQIKSFNFSYSAFYNDAYEGTSYTTLSGNNIYVTVNKNNFLLRLIRFTAKFDPGAVAFIGNSPIAERDWSYTNTLHDFSAPVLMDVYAENGDKRTYTIYVDFVDELPALPNAIEETDIEKPMEVMVYPNPNAGETLSIQTNTASQKTIAIFDVMGNTKHTLQSSEKSVSIQDISLSKGIYFIKIASEKAVITKKLVVE